MHGYPDFSFWIPMTLAKICFFPTTFAKIPVLGDTVLKGYKPDLSQLSVLDGI